MTWHPADLYDLVYGQFKDYAAESAALASLVRERVPSATRLLDVACGTGAHARHWTLEHGFAVDGLDLEQRFVDRAAAKCPDGTFTRGDMTAFALGRRYDAVVCLFSAIGYARSVERLGHALECMARHTLPGGVVVVEPWFEPGQMEAGHTTMTTAETPQRKICRATLTEIDGTVSRLRFEYLVAEATGITRASETHELGLFTRDEMAGAFAGAGLDCEYLPEGLTGRGLYVGRHRA